MSCSTEGLARGGSMSSIDRGVCINHGGLLGQFVFQHYDDVAV